MKKTPELAALQEAALAKLRKVQRDRSELDRQEVQAVADARSANVTWQKVADVLGMKQPNALRKFRPLLEEHRTVTVREDEDT